MKQTYLLLLAFLCLSLSGIGQTVTIASEGFNNSLSLFNSSQGASTAYYTLNSGAGDRKQE